MTADQFRRLALAMPQAVEGGHMGHPDFRVGGKVFATLGHPDERWAMVKLKPEQQEVLVSAGPGTFVPAKGAWGKQGSTLILLEALDESTAADVIRMARRNFAP